MKYKMLTAGKDAPACRRNMRTLVRSTRTRQKIKKTVAVAAAQTPSFIPEISIIIIAPARFVNRTHTGKIPQKCKFMQAVSLASREKPAYRAYGGRGVSLHGAHIAAGAHRTRSPAVAGSVWCLFCMVGRGKRPVIPQTPRGARPCREASMPPLQTPGIAYTTQNRLPYDPVFAPRRRSVYA